ncbi:hypothetical protein H5410_036261, partial [Solanum commersonii]
VLKKQLLPTINVKMLMCTMDWCCEECDICKEIISSSHGLEIEQFDGSSAMICQSAVQPKKRSKSPHGSTNPIEKYGSLMINIVSPRVVTSESMSIVSQGHFRNPRVTILNNFPEKIAVQLSLGSKGYMKPQNLLNAKIPKKSKKYSNRFYHSGT